MRRLTEPQPMDHGAVCGIVGALTARYSFLGAAPIGTSAEGRKIWGLTLGGGKHRVLIASAFCGAEQLTSLICLRLCEELCDALYRHTMLNDWDIHRAMMGRTVVFVPMLSPDGTDLTFHFNAKSDRLQPLGCKKSEIESLGALCHRAGFRHAVALHGRGETVCWGHGVYTPPESELMAHVLGASSGYTVTRSEDTPFQHWFIDTFRRPALTLKIGNGDDPLNFESLYRKVQEMLLISVLL